MTAKIKILTLTRYSNLGKFEGSDGEVAVYDRKILSFIASDDEWGTITTHLYCKVERGYVIQEIFKARKSACPDGVWGIHEMSLKEVLEMLENAKHLRFFPED